MNRTYGIMGCAMRCGASLAIGVILNATPSAEKAEFGRIRKDRTSELPWHGRIPDFQRVVDASDQSVGG